MQIIPLIAVKKGKLLDGKDGEPLSLDALFSQVEKDSLLYVLDLDGLEHNNPNLELYQHLTEQCTLWIDDGPRRIDDVMDTIMAGATNLTLRNVLWPDLLLSDVFELTDDEVYVSLSSSDQEKFSSIPQDITGVVVFSEDIQRTKDFTGLNTLKNRTPPQKIYLYNIAYNTRLYWEEQGINGILVDLNKKDGDR
jgi:hypothetical protein